MLGLASSCQLFGQIKLPTYTSQEVIDSISSRYGIEVCLSKRDRLIVDEDWWNLTTEIDGKNIRSINLFNTAIISKEGIVAMIRPLIPDGYQQHSLKEDAFLASGLQFDWDAHSYPESLEINKEVKSLNDSLKVVKFKANNTYVEYFDKESVPYIQTLYDDSCTAMSIYYLWKKGCERFDIVILAEPQISEKRILRFIQKHFRSHN